MIERRKNIRILHESSLQFTSGNRTYHGKMVDISRGGMKIAADTPESPQAIENITFALPKSDKPLQIPCKLVRKERKRSDEKGQILGVEFSFEDEAQMLVLETFIKEKKLAQLKTRAKDEEMRQIPRTDCVINDISCDRKGIHVSSIDNLSVDGMLISFRGKGLNPRDQMSLTFKLPDDARDIAVSGRVAYVK